MTLHFIYWFLEFLWALFGLWWGWTGAPADRVPRVCGSLIPFLLFLVLGIRLFWPIITG